jgi:sulfur-oxidizing protein SoxZ
MSAVRALVSVARTARPGDVLDVRATLQHPMETGQRVDGQGRVIPRDIVRRFEASYVGQGVFAADLYAAIAANPYIAFSFRVAGPGTLELIWRGDRGFEHREQVSIALS